MAGEPESEVRDMVRWRVKSCPRCGGDMFVDRDLDSWYEQCLQCSYRVELKPLDRVKEPVLAGERHSKKHPETEETKDKRIKVDVK